MTLSPPISYSSHFQSSLALFKEFFAQVNNYQMLIQASLAAGIFVFSTFLQKILERYFLKPLTEKETWQERLLHLAVYLAAPVIAFLLLTILTGIASAFTHNLGVCKAACQFSLIWFISLFTSRFINDTFLKIVINTLLVPYMALSAIGLVEPVLTYLDSAKLPFNGINISIYLLLKGFFIATCLFTGAKIVSNTVSDFIEEQSDLPIELKDLMNNLFKGLFYLIIALITLDLLGIDLKSLAIVGGAIGIGIGIGLQKIAANFISGFIILFEQNVKVGHLVEIQGGAKIGWIKHLGARSVVIDTDDGKEIVVPNEDLLTKTVIDWTSKDRRARTDLKVKVSFDSDLAKAKEIMLEALNSHPSISSYKKPSCFLEKFSDNGAEFLIQFWVDDLTKGRLDMQNDILLYIWRRFQEERIKHLSPFATAPI